MGRPTEVESTVRTRLGLWLRVASARRPGSGRHRLSTDGRGPRRRLRAPGRPWRVLHLPTHGGHPEQGAAGGWHQGGHCIGEPWSPLTALEAWVGTERRLPPGAMAPCGTRDTTPVPSVSHMGRMAAVAPTCPVSPPPSEHTAVAMCVHGRVWVSAWLRVCVWFVLLPRSARC